MSIFLLADGGKKFYYRKMSEQSSLQTIIQNIALILKRMTALETGQTELRTGQDELRTGQLKLIKQVKLNTSSLNRVKKDINYIVGEFDEGIVKNTRRIERIEKHLGLAQIKD